MNNIANKTIKKQMILIFFFFFLLLITSFQIYWLATVFQNEKKMVYDNAALQLEQYVGSRDSKHFVKQIGSPTSVLPNHYVDEILASMKQSVTAEVPKAVLDSLSMERSRLALDSLLEIKVSSNEQSVSDFKHKLLNVYSNLEFQVDSIKYEGFAESKSNSLSLGANQVKATAAYEPYTYILTIDNASEVVIIKMLPLLILSFIYLLICSAAVIILVRNIFKSWKLLEMKISFTNNMTHELKTPMAILYTATEALDNFNMLEDQEKSREYIQFMKSGLKRLEEMTENILMLATLNESKIILNIQETNLVSVLNDIHYKFKPLLDDKKGRIEYSTIAKDLTLQVDREHIENVLSNLIDNALKYSEDKVCVTIGAAIDADKVVMIIEDNGAGIDFAYRNDIFKPYFRVTEGNLYNIKGYGLGLSYTKEIIERHGGSIKLLRSEIGKGSAFEIKLPHHEKH